MRRIGIGTILSLGMNAFLLFWMVNQYIYDVYFQNFVNATIGPIFPFIVLALGVGGGSGLGYFVLRRRHQGESAGLKIQKPRVFRPITAVASPSSSSSSAAPRSVPTGAPPSPTSKHTVYAVPPLAKQSPSTGTRTIPSSTWSTAGKSQVPTFKPENAGRIASSTPSKSDEPKSTSNVLSFVPRTEVPLPPISTRSFELPPRPGPSATWHPEPSTQSERRLEPTVHAEKVGTESGLRQGSSTGGQETSQPSSTQTQPFQPPKWQPPSEQKPSGQWPDNSQRPGGPPPVPSKWNPPQGIPRQQGLPPPSSVPPRPGSLPPRGPGGQGPPRPFVYQGPRPGDPRPMGAPRPFGPDQSRPPQGPGQFQRPPAPPPVRQNVTGVGPMPQPWSPAQSFEKKDTPDSASQSDKASGQATAPTTLPQPRNSGEATSSGEMDWDTALDTILKTLRKDRVGDKA
ncbi:MAG TPA: hypothetical protein VFE98_01115 [Candidatus Bathyarchaeia archaeon]|nr:hypothetical protein [Candidatus Bathyarchaeia archaeon]